MPNSNKPQFPLKVVGYWFNEKKSQKFGANELAEACRKRNLDFVKINLEDDLENSQKYDVILHKLTALYAPALAGDMKAQSIVDRIEKYCRENPHIVTIDPLVAIQKLLLRVDTYSMLTTIINQDEVFTPKYAILTKESVGDRAKTLLQENNVSFPVVCKPLLAGGAKNAHEMMLVFSEKYLEDCPLPCVAQSFINHDAVLYKIFVLGAKWFVTIRPSLKNFYAGDYPPIVFNSHQISKPDSCSPLTYLDTSSSESPKVDLAVFQRIVVVVRRALKSDLLGIDVVIDKSTGRYGIIDVNPFPSFDSVPQVMDHLADAIRDRVDANNQEDYHSTFHLSINMEQKYFVQDLSKPFELRDTQRSDSTSVS